MRCHLVVVIAICSFAACCFALRPLSQFSTIFGRLSRSPSTVLAAVKMRKAVDLIHAEVLISEVMGHYVDSLESSGSKTYKCLCPFHNDKNNPSMTISDDKGVYHCFTCGKGGDTINFVQEMEILKFPEAVLKVLEIAEPSIGSLKALGLESEGAEGGRKYTKQELEFYKQKERMGEALDKAALFYASQLTQNPRAGSARSHLMKRKVTPETIYKFGIGYAPSAATAAATAAQGLPCGGTLTANLTAQGFTAEELVSAGLSMIGKSNYNSNSNSSNTSYISNSNASNENNASKLKGKGFTTTSASASTSASANSTDTYAGTGTLNLYDRFRDRLMVPIRYAIANTLTDTDTDTCTDTGTDILIN